MSTNEMPALPDGPEDDVVAAFLAQEARYDDTHLGEISDDHRSGFVAVVGRPNVGKSTLVNAMLGQKIAIVSPKPQTTRVNQLGILTRDDLQIVFVDTPGIHRPRTALGDFMVNIAVQALRDADVIVFVTDISETTNGADRNVAKLIDEAENANVIRVLNKVDANRDPDTYLARVDEHLALVAHVGWCATVAIDGKGIEDLRNLIIEQLPTGPRFYPPDQISDLWEREIATEFVREAALLYTEKEIPHAVAVAIEEYKIRPNGTIYIAATLYVERDSQKAIIIGKRGSMIKRISQHARHEMEQFTGQKVYLELHVKVMKHWRTDEDALRRLGYRIDRYS